MDFFIIRPPLIKVRLKDLFSERTRTKRRVIVSTYIDDDASSFFPDMQGVEIYCCPQAGNIDPYAIEILHKKGAIIFFSEEIHMNLFWVEGNGFIIGSASLNLKQFSSKNINDTFHELAVFCTNSSKLPINDIVLSIKKKIISEDLLDDLKEKHHLYCKTFEGLNNFTNINLPLKNIYHGFFYKEKSKILCYNCYILNKNYNNHN